MWQHGWTNNENLARCTAVSVARSKPGGQHGTGDLWSAFRGSQDEKREGVCFFGLAESLPGQSQTQNHNKLCKLPGNKVVLFFFFVVSKGVLFF